jgi:hypothetical protein
MFDFFTRHTAKDLVEEAKEKYIVTKVESRKPQPKEYYRVGFSDDGMTTLTLMADYGNSMTLSLSQEACEQLIRMLRATYKQEEPTEGETE